MASEDCLTGLGEDEVVNYDAPGPPNPMSLDDAQILGWYREGQHDKAFAEIYRVYGYQIMSHARFIARNIHDAEEITQETFLRAFRELDGFRGASKLSTWLRQIADNLLIDRIRYGKRKGRDSVESMGILPRTCPWRRQPTTDPT